MTNENAQVSLNTVSTVDNKRIPFGTRLKSTREAMGLERKDVASQLRLNEKIIVMMEKDRYPVDLPVTFIRGYLRSYAKFLQIPEFEIKKGIEPIKQKSMNVDPLTPIKQQPDTITSGDYFMQFSTYLIIFTLFALVAMWWYTHSTQKIASAIPVVETANTKPAATETADNNNANTAPTETTNASTDDNADKLSINNDQLPSTDEEMAAATARSTEVEASAPNSAQEAKSIEATATDKKPADLNTTENTNTATAAKPKAKPEQTAAAANTAAEPTRLKPAQTTAAATKPVTTPITTTPSSAVGEVIAGLEDTGDIATQIDQNSGEPVKHTAQRQKHD